MKKRILGVTVAMAFVGSAIAAVALAKGPPATWPLPPAPDGKAYICHYDGHSHLTKLGNVEYDFQIKAEPGFNYCVNPPAPVEPGIVILVSENAFGGHHVGEGAG